MRVPINPAYLLLGVALVGVVIYLRRPAGSNLAADMGAAAGGAVVDAATGVVLGIGDGIGIPRTNVSQGQAELAAGDYWNASFHLPAGEFVSGAWNRLTN
ncbi:hypothetical protein [Dechloromonas sp. HYN0024]|uniref:hypothetical protein n=1 Tax=Dechloromonas sp. HYN0024 TaxID=2231055 RepID=UPI000E445553|nr:hypothetical protein [Dechloromonas sp. HYN0024]AXS79853.1 hypothetical protein HYN24_07385 [Dechloromonas sp. HYN0024]